MDSCTRQFGYDDHLGFVNWHIGQMEDETGAVMQD